MSVTSPKLTDIRADSLLTSYQVGALLQVNPSSVNKWVKDGRIPAFRTPGGHRRIRAADLVAFLQQHQMPLPAPLAQASRRRLLVADHDAHQVEQLVRDLSGYADRVEVQVASNGIDALVHVGSFRPHLVLLDAHMPALDGIEVCRRLRAAPETHDIEVVLGSPDTEMATLSDQAAAAGARSLLAKPYEIAAVLHALGLQQQAGAPAAATAATPLA